MKFWYKYPQFCEFAQFSLRFPTRKMMRSLVCLTLLVLSATGDVRDIYQNQNRILSPFGNQPQFGALKFDYSRPYERNAAVLRQDQRIDPDGSYSWAYQTSNGISAQEQGGLRLQRGPEPSIAAQGSFSYTSPEGIPISVTYTADENGFRPQGAHLPTPPPIPPAILRALEWNAAHPEPHNPRYK